MWAWVAGVAVLGFSLMLHLGVDKRNLTRLENANNTVSELKIKVSDLKSKQKTNLETISSLRKANSLWAKTSSIDTKEIARLQAELTNERFAHETSKTVARKAMEGATEKHPEWRDANIPDDVYEQLCNTRVASCSNENR